MIVKEVKMSPLLKVRNNKMPQKHKGTKFHKKLNVSQITLVGF